MYRRSAKISIHVTLKYESQENLESAKNWDPTMCSCRHSKSSAWVRKCTVYGRSGTVL